MAVKWDVVAQGVLLCALFLKSGDALAEKANFACVSSMSCFFAIFDSANAEEKIDAFELKPGASILRNVPKPSYYCSSESGWPNPTYCQRRKVTFAGLFTSW